MNRALHGSCHVPVAAFARWEGEDLFLQGMVGSASDGRLIHAEAHGAPDATEDLGRRVADGLFEKGAAQLLAEL